MTHFNDDYEETYNLKENYTEKKFQKVPIEDSHINTVEVYNVHAGFDLSKIKCRRKVANYFIIILIIVMFIMISRILKLTDLISSDPEPVLNDDNVRDEFDGEMDNDNYNYTEEESSKYFYIIQKKENISFSNFSSPQLRKPENIKLIERLEISLDLEYSQFVHLKIIDANNTRWEVPEKDVLNEEYILKRNESKIPISSNIYDYDPDLESQYFYVELLNDQDDDDNEFKDEDKDREKNADKQDDEDKDEDAETRKDFGFRILTPDNEEIYKFTTKKNFLFSDTYINFESQITSDNIFGFGERTHDFKLNDGIYTIWPADCGKTKNDDGQGGMNQYGHQPIGLHKSKYSGYWLGFVFLNTNAQDIIIHSDKNSTYLTHKTIGGIIDYYIIVDGSPEEIIKDIKFLLGTPALPPFWSLGYHQSRYGYKSFNDFKDVYEKYKNLEIPIDAMWLDIDGLENYEVFTLNDKFKEIIPYIQNNIHKDGGKFIPKVNIGFSYEKNESSYIKLGNELNIFIKSNYTKKNLIGKTLSGKTVFPDFFHPNISEFWNQGLKDYYNLIPYDGICLDKNEPLNLLENNNSKCLGEILDENECTQEKNKYYNEELPYMPGYRKDFSNNLSSKSISENALIYGNNTIYDTKPMFSFYQTKYTYHFLNSYLSQRPFILSLSTSIGSGKYTYHWIGDNLSTFENLKNSISAIFNFNIFGIPFTGADICGYMEDATENLCKRWFNLGIFYPFTRNNNFVSSKNQFPWSFQSETINLIKKNINLRYSLLKYIYSQFFLISLNEKGSFFKPLMFDFPDDEASFEDIESKIMIGEALLLCAFFEDNENSKKFKFPNRGFNDYKTGKNVSDYIEDIESNSKNKIIELSGKFDEIHLFVREGFIIPYQNVFEKYILNTQKLKEEKINLIVNIDCYNRSKGELFFDNDEADTIENNNYIRVDMNFEGKKMVISTYENNLKKYNYKDHILGKIEFWRAKTISKSIDINKKICIKITFNKKANHSEEIEGIYDQENDKIIFEISKDGKEISLFDINEIIFN